MVRKGKSIFSYISCNRTKVTNINVAAKEARCHLGREEIENFKLLSRGIFVLQYERVGEADS